MKISTLIVTIINQPDDFEPPVEPGVIFQFDFLNFDPDNDAILQGCNNPSYMPSVKEACFENFGDQLLFVDPELENN